MLKLVTIGIFVAVNAIVGAFFWFNQPEGGGELAAWLQAFGTIDAVFAAIFVFALQADIQKRTEEKREFKEVQHMLTALRDEADTLQFLFLERYGNRIAKLENGEPLDYLFPVGTDIFQIFEGYKGSIGKIPDKDIRKKIVVAYAHARGLIYSITLNNMLVQEYQQARVSERLNSNDATKAIKQGAYDSLVYYATVIKNGWAQTQLHVHAMIEAINAKDGE